MIGRRGTTGILCLCSLMLLSGCGDFRRAVGMDRSGPDEFAIESRAPLTIPPDYELRPPKPGAPRPQEGSPAERARKAIDTAGPGEPGKQQTVALRPGAVGAISAPVDDAQTVGDRSLANKLLGSTDNTGGAQRQTTPMKGVY